MAAHAGKWFTAIPMEYREGEEFWARDAGLLCLGFRQLGMHARFVALGTPAVRADRPLILTSLAEMQEASWWRQWELEGVVLYSWALPRYEPIARAIKAAGARLVIKLDTDGLRTPREWLRRYWQVKYAYSKAAGDWSPALAATIKTAVAWPKSHWRKTLEHMAHADVVTIPSPLARQRFSRFLENCGRPDLIARLRVISHPVSPAMIYTPAVPKTPTLIAVGRWDDVIKDAPLLMRVLGRALRREPEYRARVVGRGEAALHRLARRLPEEIRARIEITGRLAPAEVSRHYQQSQIIINSSYSEGFNLSVAEALCCGCSAVGTAIMAGMTYCCSYGSGTLACDRSENNYTDALCAEIEAWKTGERDPAQISAFWTRRLHADRVAAAILSAVRTSQVPAST